MTTRAYSLLTVKSFDADKRVFRGIATTPTPDRVNDVVESLGVTYRNPLPLLLHHDQKLPVGTVNFKAPTAAGVEFEATIATIAEAGVLKDRTDEAWQSVQAGIIRGVSIGFKPIKSSRLKSGGIRFEKSDVFELSLVAVPANGEATIQVLRSLDQEHLQAASGTKKEKNHAGVSATQTKGNKTKMNFAEMLAELQTKKADLEDTLDEFVTKGLVDLSDEDNSAYDTAEAELANVEKSILRLKARMGEAVAKATPVSGKTQAEADRTRNRAPIVTKSMLPKGTSFTRYAMALAKSKGNLMQAVEIAKSFADSTPEVETVLKAAVAAGTTTNPTWAAPLVEYQTMQNEFIDLLRPETILGKMGGFRRVPFNVRMVGQTSGSTVNWVGEGSPKPVSALSFDAKTLGFAKLAGIVVVSDELIKFSDPQVTGIVQSDLIATIAGFLDSAFLDPSKAAVDGVSPASITNGVTPIAASGTTADHLKADVQKVFKAFLASGQSVAGSYWVMSATQALAISMLQNALGNREFPEINMNGGSFFGLPVVVSEATVTQGRIVLVKTNEILLAEEGIVLDSSAEASIIMDNDPGRAGAPNAVSLWQNNLFALRAERFISWGKRRPNVVSVISGANYGAITA